MDFQLRRILNAAKDEQKRHSQEGRGSEPEWEELEAVAVKLMSRSCCNGAVVGVLLLGICC